MAFEFAFAESAERKLNEIRVFERRKITDAMDRQLMFEPAVATRNRKCLGDAPAPFEHVPPLYELRVGGYRVYYNVNVAMNTVFIRAVRRKPPHKTTDEVFNEKDDD